MEERKYISIVTDLGAEKIINAVRNGGKVDIVSFAVGDGGGLPYRPTQDMTALKNEVWRGDIVSYEIMEESPNVIKVKSLLPSDVGGFTMREMALFDSENQMIAIANTADVVKVKTIEGMQSEVSLAMSIAVSNTDVVVFDIDPNLVYVSKKDLEKHNTSENAHEKLIARKIAESTIQRDIVIPNNGWSEIAEGEEGGVFIDLVQEDITEEMIPFVSIVYSDMKIARNCGMSTTIETLNGAIKFYAEKTPEKEIKASLLLLRATGGSGAYVNDTATEEEIKEMLNDVFHKESKTENKTENNDI